MALRTHFEQTKIGCPGVAEFTVQRTKALFDHITGFRQIPVAFGLRFRQRTVTVGFAHNAVQQPMFFQMLPVFRTVVAFVGIATVFFTPSGKNTKTQIKPFGYRFRQNNHASGHSISSTVCAYMP